MNTRGMTVNPVNSVALRAGSLAIAAISAGPRRRPADAADEGHPTRAPLSLDPSNPLGCHHHRVCPSRGPIGYCSAPSNPRRCRLAALANVSMAIIHEPHWLGRSAAVRVPTWLR